MKMKLELTRTPAEINERFLLLRSQRDIASLLEINYKVFKYYLEAKPIAAQYNTFEIPKKAGGIRKIAAPTTNYKIILQKLNYILQITYEQRKRPSVHGFTHNRSIVTGASPHIGSRYILNVDLEDFFPSITHKRVRGLFKAKPFSFSYGIADILAKLVCLNGYLPQGSPCSPVISNLICSRMDRELQILAQKHGCFYTRYADDITFSTKRTSFPSAIAVLHATESGTYTQAGNELSNIIENNGFELNTDKIRLQDQSNRQEVTGLIVNEFVNVKRSFVNEIRSMLYAWEKFGEKKAEEEYNAKYIGNRIRNPFVTDPSSFREVVRGKIAFLGSVRGAKDELYLKYYYWYKRLSDPTFKGSLPSSISTSKAVHRIFISYSSREYSFAYKIYSDLKRIGFDLWLDKKDIHAGRNWSDEINRGLQECDIMILIVSPLAIASTHVNDEWQAFHDAKKKIIPIIYQEIDENLYHFQLRRLQRIDFIKTEYSNALQHLVSELTT